MMNGRVFCLYSLLLIALIVFLFVSAPEPLPVETAVGQTIPVDRVFTMLEQESDVVRAVWTKQIVTAGTENGLEFDENWRQKNIEAGPLPALFLREIARNMERDPLRLSLFLGSEFPISSANQFTDEQLDRFRQLKASRQPQFFREPDSGLHTAMFADTAISKACIECHNEHKDTPKKDWKLLDVMGATTWMYPKAELTIEDALKLLHLFRSSVSVAYRRYLEKAATFARPPAIGSKWPVQGYYLPDEATFNATINRESSAATVEALIRHVETP